jgi:calcium permeable stress-gated cation channel
MASTFPICVRLVQEGAIYRNDHDYFSLCAPSIQPYRNLWLTLIGGSFFDQLDLLLENPRELIAIVSTAVPGMSAFFISMIQLNSLAYLGWELSLIPVYGYKLVLRIIRNEAMLTQRELDAAKKPFILEWGRQVPPVVFIFLVILVYMPIVPIMEVFGAMYFGLYYIVYKHQCLHVYAEDFEGGGHATWQQLFPFLMVCLYSGELIFIGYMGIKEAPTHSLLGVGPLVATYMLHQHLLRTVIGPLKNLPLEIAANVDIEDGELGEDSKGASPLYGMPVLKTGAEEERAPMPYRRAQGPEATDGAPDEEQESGFLMDDSDEGT